MWIAVNPRDKDTKNSSSLAVRSEGIPGSVQFSDLGVSLGEITVWLGWMCFNLWIPLVVFGLVYP